MKVLLMTSANAVGKDTVPSVEAIPDSAILRDGKPFFVPLWDTHWEYMPAIAYKISRLGKNIARKFALRYVDAATVALRVMPQDTLRLLSEEGAARSVATAFDGSVILGEWQALPAGDTATVAGNHGETAIPSHLDALARSIETVSRYFTLKMGDIIIPPPGSGPYPIEIDTRLEYLLDGTTALKCNIK